MGSALRFGGTMELSGLDEGIDPVRVGGHRDGGAAHFPEFRPEDFDGVPPWRGLRPCSPGMGCRIWGARRRYDNLIVATGHAMNGCESRAGDGDGRRAAVAGEAPGVEVGLLSPDRYS